MYLYRVHLNPCFAVGRLLHVDSMSRVLRNTGACQALETLAYMQSILRKQRKDFLGNVHLDKTALTSILLILTMLFQRGIFISFAHC